MYEIYITYSNSAPIIVKEDHKLDESVWGKDESVYVVKRRENI